MEICDEVDGSLEQFTNRMRSLGWSEYTVHAYKRGVRFFLKWLVADTKVQSLRDVTADVIRDWRAELESWHVAPSTKDLRFAAVKTFFRLMHEAGVIDRDPAKEVFMPKRERDRNDDVPLPSAREVAAALEAIDRGTPIDLRDRAILEVLLATGIRNSELRALTLDDVDFEDRTLLVRNGKGRKCRLAPLGRAIYALETYIDEGRPALLGATPSNILFLSREHGPLSREGLVRIVRSRMGVGPHRLRHACATAMVRRGVQQEKVQALLGHSSFDTTKIYVH